MARDRMMTKKIPRIFGSMELLSYLCISFVSKKLRIYEKIVFMDDGRHPYMRTNDDIVCGQYRG